MNLVYMKTKIYLGILSFVLGLLSLIHIYEVVVVGYGVQKKKLVTGATVQVKGDEIAKMNTRCV